MTTRTRTRTDDRGRVWEYNDAEGCYTFDNWTLGCAVNNGSKWSDWNAADRYPEEFDTLKAAMNACN